MRKGTVLFAIALGTCFSASAWAGHFKKAMIVVLENTDYDTAVTEPFLSKLAAQGASFTNFSAEAHPSQPNYVALVSGSTQGVASDAPVTVNARHLGDLLETKGLSWKVYAEQYPGGCYLGATVGKYARKHVPFLSFKDVQQDPARCARIVGASQLDADIQADALPDFSLYVPDLNDDGHDTGAAYADRWLSSAFGARLQDPRFMKDLLFVVTFDESEDQTGPNRIFTLLYGDSVAPGATSAAAYNHYSLLRTIEFELGLGTLGRDDESASAITGVWK